MSTEVQGQTHPLHPLIPDEIVAGVTQLRKAGLLGTAHRAHGVELMEPEDKAQVLASTAGRSSGACDSWSSTAPQGEPTR
jgi:Cu2+-containing amine oxidase